MRPTRETINRRLQSMLAMQALADNVDFEDLNPLLAGIVLAAFRNPLLRLVFVDKKPHIAHVTPYLRKGILLKFDDNPLENNSSKGDLRMSVMDESNVILVERNMGKVPRTEIGRSIDRRMEELGSAMANSGNYLGKAGEEYSHLLHMTTHSYGSAFVWKRFTAYNLSDFNTLKIVEQKEEDLTYGPFFNLFLELNDLAKKTRESLNEP